MCLHTERAPSAARVWCSTLAVAFYWVRRRRGGRKGRKGLCLGWTQAAAISSPSPALVGSSRRSPRTRRGARHGGGGGADEGGGGWGGLCWRRHPLDDSVPDRWGPAEGTEGGGQRCIQVYRHHLNPVWGLLLLLLYSLVWICLQLVVPSLCNRLE